MPNLHHLNLQENLSIGRAGGSGATQREKEGALSVGHDYLKAVYIAFLETCPPGTILDFWRRFPLPAADGRILSEREKFGFLWGDSGQVPLEYLWTVTEALEAFFLERGLDPDRFLERLVWRVNGSNCFPGRKLLGFLAPALPLLYKILDPRAMILRMLPYVSEAYIPGTLHRLLEERTAGPWTEAFVLYVLDRSYSGKFPSDFEKSGGLMLRKAPEVIGAPAFDELRMISDCRRVDQVLWEGGAALRDGTLFIRGEPFGAEAGYAEFCVHQGLSLKEYLVPDARGIRMDRDYRCPRRGRVVLHAGCFYGAPAYLTRLRYRKGVAAPDKPMDAIIRDIRNERNLSEGGLASRHRSFLASLDKASFRYSVEADTVFLNGAPFAKGMAARILVKALRGWLREGKTRFRFQEFKRDTFIHPHPGESFLEVRLKRLQCRFQESFPAIELALEGGGCFSFRSGVDVELREGEL